MISFIHKKNKELLQIVAETTLGTSQIWVDLYSSWNEVCVFCNSRNPDGQSGMLPLVILNKVSIGGFEKDFGVVTTSIVRPICHMAINYKVIFLCVVITWDEVINNEMNANIFTLNKLTYTRRVLNPLYFVCCNKLIIHFHTLTNTRVV